MSVNTQTYTGTVNQPYLIDFYGRATVGATGAVAAATQFGKGVTCSRTGVGLYTFQLTGTAKVPQILYADLTVVFATATNTQEMRILTVSPTTGLITAACYDSGTVDTVAELPSGSIIMWHITVQNADSVG